MIKMYKAVFDIENLGTYEKVPGLAEAMTCEMIRVECMVADKANSGILEQLNEEFRELHPDYFEDKTDACLYDLTDYVRYIVDGYQRLILDELNAANVSDLLEFFADPEEPQALKGRLKIDRNVIIKYYID